MTYKEYMLTQKNYYVYEGESEEELISNIKKSFPNNGPFDSPEYNQHFKPPRGTIFVGKDFISANYWINNYTAIYGWNIQFVKNTPSNEIKFK